MDAEQVFNIEIYKRTRLGEVTPPGAGTANLPSCKLPTHLQ